MCIYDDNIIGVNSVQKELNKERELRKKLESTMLVLREQQSATSNRITADIARIKEQSSDAAQALPLRLPSPSLVPRVLYCIHHI